MTVFLDIQYDKQKQLHCITRDKNFLTVICVDGKQYKRAYKNWQEAKRNMDLLAIVIAWGWEEV